ncbi:14373_t:CDS:2, partial [Funneliformis caledonium]
MHLMANFLVLSENTRFLEKENGLSTVFIRKCYLDLQVVVFKRNKIRITGNPGIEKTYFRYYLLYLLALQNQTILYDNANEAKPIVFYRKNATKSNSEDIEPYLRDSDVWYIVDSKELMEVHANMKVERDQYVQILYKYKKKRQAVYLFNRWRGIPQFVLENANDITHQNRLEEAISCIKEIIFDYVSESVVGTDEINHKIAHIHLDRDGKESYTQVTVRFALTYLKQRVTDQYEVRIREKLIAQIRVGIGSSLLGSSFEYIAHRILQRDTKIQQKQYLFDQATKMTIAKHHPINLAGLKLLCNKLGDTSGKDFIYYYFVIPVVLYDDFKLQTVDAKNTPVWI